MTGDDKTLKIASRLICSDQWLLTHVDPAWPILYLKQYLLLKFLTNDDHDKNTRAIPVSPRKARRRSLSPITFAAPTTRKALVTSHSSSDESSPSDFSAGVDIDDDVNITKSFTDVHRYKYNARPSTSSASDSVLRLLPEGGPDPQAYVLLTFSTTQILEDRFSLAWYGVQPNELLELHPSSVSFVSLQRCSLDAYIAPYFAARVWALRVVGNRFETTPSFMRSRTGEDENVPESKTGSSRDKSKRKVTVEWKERWAIIHQGVLSLCKERHDNHAAFSAPLNSLLSIRDSTHLVLPSQARRLRQKSSSSSASNIVCVKFGISPPPRQRTFSAESPSVGFDRRPPTSYVYASSSSGQGAWWRRGSRDVSSALSLGLTSSASVLVGSGSGTGLAEVWDAFARRGSRGGLDDCEGEPGSLGKEKGKGKEREDREDAVWVVLDMLDNSACSHILRILHRHAPSDCHSTFLPNRMTPQYSPAPSPIIFSSRVTTPATPGSPTTPGPSSNFTFPPPSTPPTSVEPSPFPSAVPLATPSPSKSYFHTPASGSETTSTRPTLVLPKIDTSVSARGPGVAYPSWRLSLVRNARRAGLGAVGRAMELVMFGDEDEDDLADDEDAVEDDELAIEWARRTSSVDPSPLQEVPQSLSDTHLTLPSRFSDLSVVSSNGESSSSRQRDVDPGFQPELDGTSNPDSTQLALPSLRPQRRSHPLVDLTSLHDTEHGTYGEEDSDASEVEWDGWVDVVVEQRKQEALALARIHQETLEQEHIDHSQPVNGFASGSGRGEFWGEGWSTQFGGSTSRIGTPSPSAGTPDRERYHGLKERRGDGEGSVEGGGDHGEYGEVGWRWPKGSDTEGSEAHSSDRHAPSTLVSQRRATDGSVSGLSSSTSRAQQANQIQAETQAQTQDLGGAAGGYGERTLSSYSSVDSLLRKTVAMRTNVKTMKSSASLSLSQAKRASMHVLFPSQSASRSEMNLSSASVSQRAASVSPPPVSSSESGSLGVGRGGHGHGHQSGHHLSLSLSRPSMASMRSATSINARMRPLSPLSSQVRDQVAYDDDGDDDDGLDCEDQDDVDDVEEGGEGEGWVESELGHNPSLSGGHHPIPLPGMRMVPAGYTTFQHSALYGGSPTGVSGGKAGKGGKTGKTGRGGREEEELHAGIVHGQSMQRLPMGMARMMTTVSSTVSVGPSARRRGGR